MTRIGIFAKTFARLTLEETLDAVAGHSIGVIQFNMRCADLPSLPDQIEPPLAVRIRDALAARQLSMAAVTGTFNVIHPNAHERHEGFRRLGVLARACAAMGTSVITLSTGTRDPDDVWRRRPDNDTPEAWDELVRSMQEAVRIAEDADVTLASSPRCPTWSTRPGKAVACATSCVPRTSRSPWTAPTFSMWANWRACGRSSMRRSTCSVPTSCSPMPKT